MDRLNLFWPCGIFFAAGKARTGLMIMLLQASLVGWPLAVRMARSFLKLREVEAMLEMFSARYQRPLAVPAKMFRAREAA